MALSPMRPDVPTHDGFSWLLLWRRLLGKVRGIVALTASHTDSRTSSDTGLKATKLEGITKIN